MTIHDKALQPQGSADEAEWQSRVDLAACFRLISLFGWDDLLATHVSARVHGTDLFLVNPFGLTFDEITASSILKVSLDGQIIGPAERIINPAAFTIHSAVHQVRHDVHCVLHLHSDNGTAVSALAQGLQPVTQTAMLVEGDLCYHDFEGVALDLDERQRLQADLGEKNYMILRNHGTLVTGRSVAEAFIRAYTMEKACAAQVGALAMRQDIMPVTPEAREKTNAVGVSMFVDSYVDAAWAALLRKLERAGMDDYAR